MPAVVVKCNFCDKAIAEFLDTDILVGGLASCRSCSPDGKWSMYDFYFRDEDKGLASFVLDDPDETEWWKE